jgi:hypothetical protein
MIRIQTQTTRLAAALLLAFGAVATANAATIVISTRDAAGVGFNDTTPVAPVGGNPGTTLGAQRLFVYQYVAGIWGAALTSPVNITVSAGWEALTCTATTAVLGSAGAWNIWHDFSGGVPGTWYNQALANKLNGSDLSAGIPDDGTGYGNVDIKTQFNVNLGNAGCLTGTSFYLGVDGNAGANVNFVETLLHELGHGLGFQVLTSNSTGNRISPVTGNYVATGGLPAIWEGYLYDNTTGKTWLAMSNAERQASAINPLALAWTGPQAIAAAGATLVNLPKLKLASSVPGLSGLYDYGTASAIGPVATNLGNFGKLAFGGNGLGCTAAGGVPATVAGKVAVISRGVCGFAEKAKNAQLAGAIGVIIANNQAGGAIALGGADASVTIPTISVSQVDGNKILAGIETAMKYGSRLSPGVVTSILTTDPTRKAGADALGRPLMNTPSVLAAGSSVSHWDPSALPNLLMEPAINSDLTTLLVPPKDITLPLLKDIGW